MIQHKRGLNVIVVLVTLLASASVWALEPLSTSFFGNLAVKGGDPVAYFLQGEPLQGRRQYTHEWQVATWRFVSAENRDRFAANPEDYAPQYGGYCAWAVAQGYTAPIDPTAWNIVEGKLYLNYDKNVQTKWEKDIPRFIEQADKNWPRLLQEG